MSKFIKYTHLESGPFTKTNNRCQIVFDADGVTNLRDSYLDVVCRFKDSNNVFIKNNEVFLGDHVSRVSYSPSALIKHITLSTESTGIVEENRYVNRYNQTMRQYTMTKEELESLEVFGYRKVEVEENEEAHLMVPLREILGSAMASNYPNQRLGKSTLKIEFEDVLQVFYSSPKPFFNVPQLSLARINNSANPNTLSVSQISTTATFDSAETFKQYYAKDTPVTVVSTTNAINHQSVVTATAYDTTNKTGIITLASSFDIHASTDVQDLKVNTSATGVTPFTNTTLTNSGDTLTQLTTTSKTLHENVAYYIAFRVNQNYYMVHQAPKTISESGGNTILTFAKPLYTASSNGQTVANIQIMATPEFLDYEIADVELVLNKPNKYSVPKSFSYATWQVESVNQPATTDYRRQFEVDPSCSKVYFMTPVNHLVSVNDNMESYRASINGFDTTNRDVVVAPNSALYQDKLIGCIANLRSLNPLNGSSNVLVVPEEMPMTGQENVLQLRAKYSQACTAKVVYLFKIVNRSI